MLINAREPAEESNREPYIKGIEVPVSLVTGPEFLVDDRKQTSVSNLFYFDSRMWTKCSSLLLLVCLSKQIDDYPFRLDGRLAFLPLKECCPRFSHYVQITLCWQSKCKTWAQAEPSRGSLVNSSSYRFELRQLSVSPSGQIVLLQSWNMSEAKTHQSREVNIYGSSTNCATHI
jgi:hypothetical protein